MGKCCYIHRKYKQADLLRQKNALYFRQKINQWIASVNSKRSFCCNEQHQSNTIMFILDGYYPVFNIYNR